MRRMETIQDLIEEAKIRFVWWTICIFAITYFLSHTSKSMWMNIPIAILIAYLLRILSRAIEFHWKINPPSRKKVYLSCLEKKQLSVNDSRLSTTPPPPKWRRKFDSPIVEAAVEDFVDIIIQDFVTDLWYSVITPDEEAPELMRAIILEALGEVAGRVKEVNIVDLLTRDIVDLIGDHLELFRKTQASIGVDVMVTLSTEERDERLKQKLMSSKELHPALISTESEYKFLKRLVAGLLGLVLRPREAECPLVRCIAREFVTSLVIQPIMNLVSPMYVNEVVEFVLLHIKDFLTGLDGDDQSSKADHDHSTAEESISSGESSLGRHSSHNQETNVPRAGKDDHRKIALEASEGPSSNTSHGESMQSKVADWARILDAATQRRTEVLAPENLENMWAIGTHYKEKINGQVNDSCNNKTKVSHDAQNISSLKEMVFINEVGDTNIITPDGNKSRLKRSSSTSDVKFESQEKCENAGESKGLLISEDFYSPYSGRPGGHHKFNDSVIHAEGSHLTKLRCRVVGAYFETIGSKSFAVYSVAVTNSQNTSWFVKRRYSNFERLHRLLKDIPNYNLHLPPKRIFSSSTEDAFVHQRCIQLNKYLQDLLSIGNVAEQHEVWDFLSASSKNYSFGKSSSLIKTLSVSVDDGVDDIVCQFKSSHYEALKSVPARNLSLNERDLMIHSSMDSPLDTTNKLFDVEEGNKDEIHDHEITDSSVKQSRWHSDNELNSNNFLPLVAEQIEVTKRSYSGKMPSKLGRTTSLPFASHTVVDPIGVPPEWTPPNVTVPVLNLVDKVFQLNRRGWIRRQVFWISKQILQLVMEDAVDDWLLGQINWLRREDVVAQGIRWVKDILWPDGKFFLKLELNGSGFDEMDCKSFQATPRATSSKSTPFGSFEMQLEAARRASFVRKMLFNGAPTPLVSFVGQKQYKRCARDIYFFLQSSICLKQVAYTVLELLLVSVFPELKNVVEDIHQKMQV